MTQSILLATLHRAAARTFTFTSTALTSALLVACGGGGGGGSAPEVLPVLTLSGPATYNEAAGTATYSVTLGSASASTVTVGYATANGTAQAGSDYSAASGTLSFAPGAALTQTVTVPILNDALAEGAETFSLNLTAPSGATLGTSTSLTTLVDSGPAVASASADRLSYGRLSTFTVDGSSLSGNLGYAVTGCDGLTLLAGATAARQVFTCTPHALALRLAVSSAGAEIYSTALTVPKPRVDLAFASGSVVVELEPEKTPITVDNFLAYVNSGYYNATLVHRVVAGFVNQGGGYSAVAATTLTAKPGLSPAIVLETNKGLANTRGTIAMARTSVADSATSQFFFNQVDNPSLDYASAANPGYAVFGRVVSGQAVLDAINAVATRTVGAFANVPSTDIFVQTAVQSQ